jgi:hypothetical protein
VHIARGGGLRVRGIRVHMDVDNRKRALLRDQTPS